MNATLDIDIYGNSRAEQVDISLLLSLSIVTPSNREIRNTLLIKSFYFHPSNP